MNNPSESGKHRYHYNKLQLNLWWEARVSLLREIKLATHRTSHPLRLFVRFWLPQFQVSFKKRQLTSVTQVIR